jgi:hypothetical protein
VRGRQQGPGDMQFEGRTSAGRTCRARGRSTPARPPPGSRRARCRPRASAAPRTWPRCARGTPARAHLRPLTTPRSTRARGPAARARAGALSWPRPSALSSGGRRHAIVPQCTNMHQTCHTWSRATPVSEHSGQQGQGGPALCTGGTASCPGRRADSAHVLRPAGNPRVTAQGRSARTQAHRLGSMTGPRRGSHLRVRHARFSTSARHAGPRSMRGPDAGAVRARGRAAAPWRRLPRDGPAAGWLAPGAAGAARPARAARPRPRPRG